MTSTDNTERLERIFEAYDAEYRKQKLTEDFRMTPVAFNISNLETQLIADLSKKFSLNKSEFIRVCINYFATSVNYKIR